MLLVITRPGHLVPRDLVDDYDVEEKEWKALTVTSRSTESMSHSQMLGKFEYTLPAKF